MRFTLAVPRVIPFAKKDTPSALLSAEAAVWVRVALTFATLTSRWVHVDRGVIEIEVEDPHAHGGIAVDDSGEAGVVGDHGCGSWSG